MIEPSGERYAAQRAITDDIDAKLAKINADTGLLSSPTHKLHHEDFKALVAMGDRIVPYLFHHLVCHGFTWTHSLLLRHILGFSPIKDENRGKFYHILHDWLGWYLESPYREKSDIYYGLVE